MLFRSRGRVGAGTAARGDAEPGSDIDVLLLVDASRQDISARNWQVGDLAAELLLDYGIVVSPIVENRDYFNKNVNVLPFYSHCPFDHITDHRRARNQRFRARFLRSSSGFIPRLLFAFCPVAQLCCGAVWAAIRACPGRTWHRLGERAAKGSTGEGRIALVFEKKSDRKSVV